MANRVTKDDVFVIFPFSDDITTAIADIFILAANQLTNKVETEGGLTDADILKEIERWLSAHFIAIREPQAKSERAGDVAQTVQEKVDLYFAQTRYGQMALLLDTTGTLAELQRDTVEGGSRTALIKTMDWQRNL